MQRLLSLYKVDPSYIKYLHSIDGRISVKYNNRPFVGIITMLNGICYVVPLTSQTTDIRRQEGKKKRSSQITSFIKDGKGQEIADLLYNNMFPVIDGVCELIEINPDKDTYELNEIRYIRKNREEIIKKAQKVYDKRNSQKDAFFNKTCCDYEKLESTFKAFGDNNGSKGK